MSTSSEIMEAKKMLRKEVLIRRRSLDAQARQRASLCLFQRMLSEEQYCKAEVILGFAGYGDEIDIDAVLEDVLQKGKKLFLPRVNGETMDFYLVTSLQELTEGYKGIREPDGTTEVFSCTKYADKCVLMLMPGVAFDTQGHRMGYGKGFYDKYLEGKSDLQENTIALGFDCQMVAEIPCDERDICPAKIICV